MGLLWEKFQWILPLYMKTISFQSKTSVVCSVTAAIFIDFCLKKLNVFSQRIGQKQMNIWIPQNKSHELKCWSTFCVNYFLRYYLMMQHPLVVKRVNGTHESAHRPYQLLSAPYHCCLYKYRRQDERQPPPEQLTGAHLYLDIARSGYFFHAVGNVMNLVGPTLIFPVI